MITPEELRRLRYEQYVQRLTAEESSYMKEVDNLIREAGLINRREVILCPERSTRRVIKALRILNWQIDIVSGNYVLNART